MNQMWDLKEWPEFFKLRKEGKLPFTLRSNEDKNFDVLDFITFREFDPKQNQYTGSPPLVRKIISIAYGGEGEGEWRALKKGWCVMGLEVVEDKTE